MAELAPKPTPLLPQPNAVGVRQLAQALQNVDADGDKALAAYNAAVRQGPKQTNAVLGKLQQAADAIGYMGDVRYGTYAAPKVAAPAPSPVKQAESSVMTEIGKSAWNSLVDTAAGIGRLPQVAFDASTAAGTTFGAAMNDQTEQTVSSKLKSVGDFTQSMLDHLKLDIDQTGRYDKGIVSRGSDGWFEPNDLEGSAHAIGSSLGFVASMMAPGAIAGRVGKIPALIKAAQAAGDVEKVAELTKLAVSGSKMMKLTGGIVSQLQPLYQDAIDAGLDSRTASRFAAIVAPPVAALDAFTGIENLVGPSSSGLRKGIIQQVLRGLGKDITEESLVGASKSILSRLGERLGEGATQFAIEAGTETPQEGYQVLIEKLFDKNEGVDYFGGRGQDTGERLMNAGLMGGIFGAGFGAALHRTGAYHPTAFKVLQDAYLQEGKVGIQAALDDLSDGATSMAQSGEVDGDQIKSQLGKMTSVIQSFKNPYTVSPKTQFQFYDLNYNQLPQQQQTLDELTARQQSLTSDQPTDIDENGNSFPVDPVIAQREAALLAPQIADQQRRVAYLDGAKTRLAETGSYQDWGKNFELIGKFQPGDRIGGIDADTRDNVDGTVSNISNDGQMLTVEVTPVGGGEARSVEVRANEANPGGLGSTKTDVQQTQSGPIAVGDSIKDGFIDYQDERQYPVGSRVVLASNPDASYPVTDSTPNEQGEPVLTINGPDGPVTGTVAQLTDKSSSSRIIGSYSPGLALDIQDARKAQADKQQKLTKLKDKLGSSTITALDAMTDDELRNRYNSISPGDEKNYVAMLADDKGVTLNPVPVSQQTADVLDADIPTVDPYNITGEDIDDETWNQIADGADVPDAVLTGMAARLLDDVNLSERQQQLFDDLSDIEAARLDDIQFQLTAGIIQQQLATNEPATQSQVDNAPVPESTDSSADAIGSVDAGPQGTRQDATEGTGTESPVPVPDSVGPVRPELANEQPTDLPGESGGTVAAPTAPAVRPDNGIAGPTVALPDTTPITDDEYKAFRQSPADHQFAPGVLAGIAQRIATGESTTRDNAIYKLRKGDIDPLMRVYNEAATALRQQQNQTALEANPDIKALDEESDEIGREIEQQDRYEAERQQRMAEDSTPSDEQIDAQLKQLAAGERTSRRKAAAQAVAEPIIDGEELEIEGDLDPDEVAAQAAVDTPVDEVTVGSMGVSVKVLLSGGKVTLGTIVGRNADGDIVVRHLNRQGTQEDDFPHSASAILSPSGKAITIDPALAAYVAPKLGGLDAAKLKPKDRVVIRGTSSPRVVAEIVSVNKDGTADVRVVLSGATRTVPASEMSQPTTSELTAVDNKLKERKAQADKSVVVNRQASTSTGTPVGEQALSQMAAKLSAAFPRIRTVLLSGQAMLERFGVNDRGRIENGTVYLNTDTATADTPVHEFAHPYVELMKRDMPQSYRRGIELVTGSAYEQTVRDTRPDLVTDEQVRDEALVQAIGEKGVRITEPTRLDSFLSWVKLQLQRIGNKIGIPLGLETTLDKFATARADELLSGYKISDFTGEGTTNRQAAATILPNTASEQWLNQNGNDLDAAGRKALLEAQVSYDPATGEYTKQTVDQIAEQSDMRVSLNEIKKAGGVSEWLVKHANLLDQSNLGRILFGEQTQRGKAWQTLLDQQLRLVAPMKTAGHKAFAGFYEQLAGRTMYRGASTYEAVDKWDIVGTVAGQNVSMRLPVDIAMDIAMQYRTIITTKGHFDPQHRQKTAAGQAPTMMVQLPNVDDPKNPIFIELDKAQLRTLEDRVFNQDAGTMAVVDGWRSHSKAMFTNINRMHTLETGKPLDEIADYYPITTMKSDEEILNRSIATFTSDAGYFKDRQTGAPKGIRADGFLASANRYQGTAEDYVQLTPLWQNMRALAIRQQPLLSQMGYNRLHESLNRLADAMRQPSGGNKKIQLVWDWDISKLLKLATLSRFAFNVAIPLKQTTAFFSAFGSGAIKAKYLDNELLAYLKMIGQSYALAGRGSRAGNYAVLGGGATTFDEGRAELQSIGTPDADTLLWRAQGQVAPDIFFADGADGRATQANQLKSKLRSYFEEYGLSISQRADTAIVFTLYRAAKAQVMAESPNLSPQQQMAEAASRAKQALYYSNQTFDQSDRAAVQFARNPTEQFLLLYKGQGIKIMNTMARRQIEVAQAKTPDEKKAAQARLRANVALNAVLAPLITAAVDMAVTGLRGLSKADDDRDDKLTEDQKIEQSYKDGGFAYLSSALSQFLPAEMGEAAAGIAYMASNPESKRQFFDANAVGSAVEMYTALSNLGVTLTTRHFTDRDAFERQLLKVSQTAIRATATRTGVPMEAVRQVNNGLGHLIESKETHSRSRSRGRGQQRDVNYGLEYITGTEEEVRRRGRR